MLSVLKPVTFSAPMLWATNAVETVLPWVPSTYAIGQTVAWSDANGFPRVWESLANSNTAEPGNDDTKWTVVRATNPYAMFDDRVASQTTRDGDLIVTVTPQSVLTTVALLNVVGNTVTLEVLEEDVPIYSETVDLRRNTVFDWYTYFTAPFEHVTRAVFYNVPAYYSSKLRVTITGASTAVGHMIFGPLVELGHVKYGAGSGIIDYSVKRKDETFGDAVFVERDFADENTFSISVPKSRSNVVKNTLRAVRATPCLWIGSDDEEYAESLITYGWYRNHTLVAQYFDESLLDIEIEGLV